MTKSTHNGSRITSLSKKSLTKSPSSAHILVMDHYMNLNSLLSFVTISSQKYHSISINMLS